MTWTRQRRLISILMAAQPLTIFPGLLLAVSVALQASGQPQSSVTSEISQSTYFWRSQDLGGTAQLVTLFCRFKDPAEAPEGTPLVAVLRDTLGDTNPTNDRLTEVWLLTYEKPDITQRVLSAVPFFYWHVGDGLKSTSQHDTSPLLNLAEPEHPVMADISRDLLQWTMLDPSTTPIRATSRAYRTNEVDHERLHLEEAISYLRQAPVSNDESALTRTQVDTMIARLELRKKLLGGFVNEREAARLGAGARDQQERIRSRNWELLRQCAEKTGLIFESLQLGSTSGEYAILWFPLKEPSEPAGTSLGAIWKLLNIKNPYQDERLQNWRGPIFTRSVDDDGRLQEASGSGSKSIQLVPLGMYSLNYPKVPLLLIDFRDKLHVRWHEMTQRSINEITAGVIGISHFTNWYYYVGADLYDFWASRHGVAVDQSTRLDCYSEFRVELTLDRHLDPSLRREMQERIKSLEINPLEGNPRQELATARVRFANLEQEAGPNGLLLKRINKDRREELASFGASKKALARDEMLHTLSLGTYTHRTKEDAEELARLDSYRRVQYQLNFLDSLVKDGTQPEVSFDSVRIRASIEELKALMPQVQSAQVRARATLTLDGLRDLSQDVVLQADCSQAVAAIRANTGLPQPESTPGTTTGVGAPGVALELIAPQPLQ